MWITPKTDWKETDYYNAKDVNRIENNTQEVANYLKDLQYDIPLGVVKTDRDTTSIDFVSSMNRIEQNIDIIKDSFLTPPNYPSTKIWAAGVPFDYNDANRLEKKLSLLYEWAMKAKDNLIYCGTFDCGMQDEGGLY